MMPVLVGCVSPAGSEKPPSAQGGALISNETTPTAAALEAEATGSEARRLAGSAEARRADGDSVLDELAAAAPAASADATAGDTLLRRRAASCDARRAGDSAESIDPLRSGDGIGRAREVRSKGDGACWHEPRVSHSSTRATSPRGLDISRDLERDRLDEASKDRCENLLVSSK